MSETPETDAAVLHDGTVVAVDVARRMEAQRNEIFQELNEAKRMLEWHKRKTQNAVDAMMEAIRERKETEARLNSKDLLVKETIK
jgi:hypothetical protein